MKSSFFHYLKEIILYGVLVPISTVIVGFHLFTTFYPISDSLLTDFLKAFTEQRILAIVFVLILCFIFFGSIYYCISCGRNRKLIPDKVYTQITTYISSVGLATAAIAVATLTLTELQFSILTGWIAFIALLLPLLKFKVQYSTYQSSDNVAQKTTENKAN